MNALQLVTISVIFAVVSADVKPWTGPLAENKIGELVQETPEVAAARRLHEETFAKIRAILPELPLEEQHVSDYTPVHVPHHHPVVTPAPFPHHFPVVTHAPLPHNFAPALEGTGAPWTGPIADHKLGEVVRETPEVAAARKHHQEVFSRVRSTLPELRDETVSAPVQAFPSRTVHKEIDQVKAFMERVAYLQSLVSHPTTSTVAPVFDHNNQFLVDTPEVAAAKLQHARAIAAVLGH